MIHVSSKRTAFTWDPEYKDAVDDIKDLLKPKDAPRPGNPEIFMLCLSFGYHSRLLRPTPPRKSDSMRMNNLKEEQLTIMRMIALEEHGESDILLDDDKVFDIAEGYAAGGLMLLSKMIKDGGDFRAKLITTLAKELKASSKTYLSVES